MLGFKISLATAFLLTLITFTLVAATLVTGLFILNAAGIEVYGQTPTGSSTFKDPQGKFYLQYPSDWTAKGKENRFSPADLMIIKPTPPGVIVTITPHNQSNPLLDLKVAVDEIVELAEISNAFPQFSLFQAPEFTKYKINGQPTGSFIYTWQNADPELDMATSSLTTKTKLGNLFSIDYSTTQDDFDKYLPNVEKIISSIKMDDILW
jgi:hypothetical protein